jgi:hypothetical protein
MSAAYYRQRRHDKKARGECLDCPNPRQAPYARCRDCRLRMSNLQRDYRERQTEARLDAKHYGLHKERLIRRIVSTLRGAKRDDMILRLMTDPRMLEVELTRCMARMKRGAL